MRGPELAHRDRPRFAEGQCVPSGSADPGDEDSRVRIYFLVEMIEAALIERDDIAALVLAEEQRDGLAAVELVDGRADARGNRHLCQRYGEAAVGYIVHSRRQAVADEDADEIADALLVREVDEGRPAFAPA